MENNRAHLNSIRESKPLDEFVIYKWAELILKLDPLDSLLPLSLQIFFVLFLEDKNFSSTQFFNRSNKG
jgi:hypothetical protein